MSKLTHQQAHDLGVEFSQMAEEIQNYREAQRDEISPEEDRILEMAVFDLLKQSNELLIQSAVFVMDDAQESLHQIGVITQSIKKTLKKLDNIQRVIDVVTAFVTLGSAVVARNPETILETLGVLRKKAKELKPEDSQKK